MRANEFLLHIANTALSWQRPDGSFPAGHNGPYHDPETPVRNSGHWLIVFSKCYAFSGEDKYKDAIYRIAKYLTSTEARPEGYSFFHRKTDRKDRCNGLIGPAWSIESLVEASVVLDDRQYADIAKEVFLKHLFNEEKGLWQRLEINGDSLSIDGTFNHQLWFAACGALIQEGSDSEVRRRVQVFLDKITDNVTILDDGLIHHEIEWYSQQGMQRPRRRLSRFVKEITNAAKNKTLPQFHSIGKLMLLRRVQELHRSIGYHSFNMYAFAMLKGQMPEHAFWGNNRFHKAITYMTTPEYEMALDENRYGYPYNPPGFEVPYALSMLGNISDNDLDSMSEKWINAQIGRCYDSESHMMDRCTEDPVTHTARIYELARIPDKVLAAVTINI